MKRFYGVVGALMLVALPVYAAQGTKPADKAAAKAEQAAKPAVEKAQAATDKAQAATEKAQAAKEKVQAAKPMTASGTVSAVAADSLTIKAKTEEMTFKVDSSTKVIGTGATHKTEELKNEKKETIITEYVKTGDEVRVTYHEKDGTKHAASVRVVTAKPAAK